ncbi:MAG: NAD(P)H-hydrate dehydratase [Clostridiales bacterium]|nr:NAD(P)H-hydrate dehydratase [Clostridiales bacterium]
MRALEQAAVNQGETYLGLMDQAGTAAAQVIKEMACRLQRAVILCGKGNNGGDGFVIARRLREHGVLVSVILLEGEPCTQDAAHMFTKMGEVEVLTYQQPECSDLVQQADVVVDAVYGIGFRGSIQSQYASLIEGVNRCSAQIFAVDLPSGAQGDTGKIEGSCIRADVTITFTTLKPAHVLLPASDYCGKTVVVQVGISPALLDSSPSVMGVIGEETVRRALPVRAKNSHKGTYGALLSVCGSLGMAGAAMLSAGAALRCGVGLLRLAVPKSIYPVVAGVLPEPVYLPLNENNKGTLSKQCQARLQGELGFATACLIGCGMGCNSDTQQLVSGLLDQAEIPLIIDADGINALCANIDRVKAAKAPVIVTPHPGEMARLIGCTAAQVQANRLEYSRKFAQEYRVILVLKGADTLIALPDERVFVNRTGNPGMARGGSGDVLAGMIASFAAQGIAPEDAALCGVYLHGLAGDRCAEECSLTGMLPTDLIERLPKLFLEFGR